LDLLGRYFVLPIASQKRRKRKIRIATTDTTAAPAAKPMKNSRMACFPGQFGEKYEMSLVSHPVGMSFSTVSKNALNPVSAPTNRLVPATTTAALAAAPTPKPIANAFTLNLQSYAVHACS